MSDDSHDRLKKLSGQIAEIRAAQSAEHEKAEQNEREAENMSTGMRAGAELVSCLIAGAFLGWVVDHSFHTSPIGLIFFILSGITVGFYEVYRLSK